MASAEVQTESRGPTNDLALNLYRLLAKEEGNVLFSPFSISTGMAMLLCGSEKETETEMRKALGYDHAGISSQDIPSVIKQHTSSLLAHKDSNILSFANSILTQETFEIKKDYKLLLNESFQALHLEVDFQRNSQNVAMQINEWVQKKTNNMISQLLEELDPSSIIVLLNAVYFKGTWLWKFDKKSISPNKFYNYGELKEFKMVDMMRVKASFPYFRKKDAYQALELPYISENISMLILLPWNKSCLVELESNLTPSFFHYLREAMIKQKVNVTLPRFKLEYTKVLIPYIKQLGVEKIFSFDAELGGISESKGGFVTDIIHKAVLEVNEKGSQKAPATAVIVSRPKYTGLQRPEAHFVANDPFVFVIYEKKSDMILFMGRVKEL